MLKLHAIYFTLPNMQVNKYLYDIGSRLKAHLQLYKCSFVAVQNVDKPFYKISSVIRWYE